jgi:hypothetical protein
MIEWKSIVKTVAPALGTALGGPLAGAATKFIADKLLGNPDASEDQIAQAIQTATPDQLLKLKELDNNFALENKRIGLEYYKTDASDRANARDANVKNNNPVDEIIKLYLLFTLSMVLYFCLYALIQQKVEGVEANIISGILGSAFTALLAMVYFYWGTSKGSDAKDEFIMKDK